MKKVMEKAEHFNLLPRQYASWTQFFLSMDLAPIIGFSAIRDDAGSIVFDMAQLPGSNGESKGRLEIEFEFFKARLFDEFLTSSALNRDVCDTLARAISTHPDRVDKARPVRDAMSEILLMGEVVSRARENPPTLFSWLNNLN